MNLNRVIDGLSLWLSPSSIEPSGKRAAASRRLENLRERVEHELLVELDARQEFPCDHAGFLVLLAEYLFRE